MDMWVIADFIINLIALMIGASFGLVVADIDQNIPFIKHRSALTHGPIWPAMVAREPIDSPMTLAFFVGFFVAYAIHLNFDMWPKAWAGIAKVHMAGKWRLNGLLSFCWLAAGVVGSLYLVAGWVSGYELGLWGGLVLLGLLFVHKLQAGESLVGPVASMIVIVAGLLYQIGGDL